MGQAFARAAAMFALITAAMQLKGMAAQQEALAKIGPYRSRGKGMGLSNRKPKRGMLHHRAALKKRAQLRNRIAQR